MSRAVNDPEDLGKRDHKIEDLWQEKQEHGLCEVTQDAYHSESHACKIAECVANEDLRGELIVLEQTQSHKDERYNNCH